MYRSPKIVVNKKGTGGLPKPEIFLLQLKDQVFLRNMK
jgi:hypothetical protein